VWQKRFEKYGSDDFTIVGLALEAEGIPPAKRYYERFGVTFPALVDPNYATRFQAVPKTFFVDEHGMVLSSQHWQERLDQMGEPQAVTDAVRKHWSPSQARLDTAAIAGLVQANDNRPAELTIATQLGSRYLALGLTGQARTILQRAVGHYDAKKVAKSEGERPRLLAQAYFQLARACTEDREQQVRYATLSFYLEPSVGFGKQIARIIAPEKFDGRADGSFDNTFREATLQRLTEQRKEWLSGASDSP
jgi:hypothetical protein